MKLPFSSNVSAISLAAFAVLLTASWGLGQRSVDLSTWTEESYPSVSGFAAGNWTVSPDGQTVSQTVNGQPTFFVSDFNARGTEVKGKITVFGGGDDDYVGFALGISPGDSINPNADYLLVDWKGGTQSFNFGVPSCTPGAVAGAGLAVSRVSGIPTADEFWGHTNFDDATCSDLNNGLQELARGATLGATGWTLNTTYEFSFEYTETNLKVSVNGVLQIDVNGSFPDGSLAFYNFSQGGVRYEAFTLACLADSGLFGDGTAGTLSVPSLGLSAAPLIGTDVDIQVGSSQSATTLGCLGLSLSMATAPDPVFGTRILIGLDSGAVFVPVHTLPASGAVVIMSIPNDPNLCGLEVFGQTVVFDPAAPLGLAFSRGLRILVGEVGN